MCGIAGILRLSGEIPGSDHTRSARILQLLKHRGPDTMRSLDKGSLSFYHSRLSIIDTSEASSQPFFYEGENDALIYNGEIFNYKELSANIGNLRTGGDTEIVYRLIREKGKDALHILNGFFALAYTDGNGNLIIARDRFGEKPLYYYGDKNIFAFASELKPLMELIGPRELDPGQLYTYFRLNYCSGPHSIFKNVKRLLPGQALKVSEGKVTTEQWYKVKTPAPGGDLGSILEDAVRIRLRSDVPLGAFLSGGLDSSIVSALARRHEPALKTFSIGFTGESYLDESLYAEKVARHIGSDHTTIRLSETDFLSNLDYFLDSVDEPFADSSAFNVYMLSRYCREQIKVALSGDGADELFKGYNKHRALLLSSKRGSGFLAGLLSGLLPGTKSSRSSSVGDTKRKLDKFAALSVLPREERIKFLAGITNHTVCVSLLNQGVSSIYFDSLFAAAAAMEGFPPEDRFDIEHVLADDMLVKTDRFGMRHGLEIRSPFLDHRVVELALAQEPAKKISASQQKIMLRKTFAHLLPKETLTRSKKGFEVPLERWLRTHLRERIEKEWLSREALDDHGLFSETEVKEVMWQLWTGSSPEAPARIWALIVFQQWWKNYRQYIVLPSTEIPAAKI